jgi:osmotically-inducible protein OsmY/sporulation protein YlmC with PRC-barrel domain
MTGQHGVITIGGTVLCLDGIGGHVRQIVVDPDRRRVMGLVVDRGLGHADVVVSANAITAMNEDGVQIQLARGELSRLPALPEHHGIGDVRTRLRHALHKSAGEPSEQSPENSAVLLHADHVVRCTDGLAGRLECLLVALPQLDITGVVIHQGRLHGHSVRVPTAWIAALERDAIQLTEPCTALQDLPEYRPDHVILEEVERALDQDEAVHRADAASIAVSVTDGIVTLRGYVSDGRNVARAEDLARGVRGVRSVNNVLICDAQILLDVAQALARDARTRDSAIGINATHGAVVLFGEVSHPSVRSAAEDVVARVPHVRMVFNQLTVRGMAPTEEDTRMLLPRPGQHVFATDMLLGRVERVVISPRSRRVTAVVVRGMLPDPSTEHIGVLFDTTAQQPRAVVLPVSMIDSIGVTDVFLQVDGRTACNAPVFDPAEYVAPDPGWEPPFPYQHADVLLDLHQRRVARTDLQPARGGRLAAAPTTAADGAWIARGDLVAFRDGQAGVIDHVLLDPKTGAICHLVVRAGVFFDRDTVIPAEWVHNVDRGNVFVDVGAEQLAALPSYQPPRSDAEMAGDVRTRLQAMPAVTAGQAHLEVGANGGIIRLRGIVPSQADRRAAEAIAQQTAGVWDVDNQLTSTEQSA